MSRPATSRLKVNPPLGAPPTLEWRALTDLGIDPVYQRSVRNETSISLIRRIAQFWDWGLCQPLAVARRPDGELMVVDGQHRLEAARMRRDIAHLPCVITAYHSMGDEAAAFVALNQQRRPLSKLDLFKAALAAEDETATAIAAAMEQAGLTLAPHSNHTAWKPGMVSNIGGIQAAWRDKGTGVVTTALRALAIGFEGQVLRYAGTIFPGLAALVAFLNVSGEDEFKRLVNALRGRSQIQWRQAISRHQAETNERRERAGRAVILAAFMELGGVTHLPGGGAPAPALPTSLNPGEQAWCEQCDRRVGSERAAACTSPFCKLKVKAA